MNLPEQLYDYQKWDNIIADYNRFKKQSKTRQSLLKLQKSLVTNQEKLVELDDEAQQRHTAFAELAKGYDAIAASLRAEVQKIQNGEVTMASQLDQIAKNAAELKEKLEELKTKILGFSKEHDAFNAQVEEYGKLIKSEKAEYLELKKQYDTELADFSGDYKSARDEKAKLDEELSEDVLAKYKAVKSTKNPAVVLVEGGVCTGCNMKLPSATISKLSAGTDLVECESCGRLLCLAK